MKLSDTIQVLPEKINTKVIFDQKGVKSTLFAVPKSHSIPEHSSPNDALLIMLEGSAQIRMNGKIQEVSTGDFVEFQEKVAHSLFAITDFKMILTR